MGHLPHEGRRAGFYGRGVQQDARQVRFIDGLGRGAEVLGGSGVLLSEWLGGRCRNEKNGMPRKTHDDIKQESQAFRIAMMIASRSAAPARDLERAGLRAPQPVRCEICQWRGRRLTPRRAPCPACGSRVEFA